MGVRTGADESHRDDRVVGDLGVAVVRQLAERVEHLQLGAGGGGEGEGEGYRPPDHRLAVTQLEHAAATHQGRRKTTIVVKKMIFKKNYISEKIYTIFFVLKN